MTMWMITTYLLFKINRDICHKNGAVFKAESDNSHCLKSTHSYHALPPSKWYRGSHVFPRWKFEGRLLVWQLGHDNEFPLESGWILKNQNQPNSISESIIECLCKYKGNLNKRVVKYTSIKRFFTLQDGFNQITSSCKLSGHHCVPHKVLEYVV